MNKKHTIAVVALKAEDPKQDLVEVFSEVLYTGVGKVNATLKLTQHLTEMALNGYVMKDIVVMNLGSAGSSFFKKGLAVKCDVAIQRDMDCTPIGFKPYETPFEPSSVQALAIDHGGRPEEITDLAHVPNDLVLCYTADAFINEGNSLASKPHVVEMEAYALAKVCNYFGVQFTALKYISDGSSDDASEEWTNNAPASIPVLLELAKQELAAYAQS